MLLLPPIVAAAVIKDSLGREWDPLKHPRDRKGRFIHTARLIRAFFNHDDTDAWATGSVVKINENGSVRMKVEKVADPAHNMYVGQMIDVVPDNVENINEKAKLNIFGKPIQDKPVDLGEKYDFSLSKVDDFAEKAGLTSEDATRIVEATEAYKSGKSHMITDTPRYHLALYAKSISGDGKEHPDGDYMDLLTKMGLDPDVIDDTPDGMSGLKFLADEVNAGRSPNNNNKDSINWFNEVPPTDVNAVREAQLRDSDVRVRWYQDGTQSVVWPDGTEEQHDKAKGSLLLAAQEVHQTPGTGPSAVGPDVDSPNPLADVPDVADYGDVDPYDVRDIGESLNNSYADDATHIQDALYRVADAMDDETLEPNEARQQLIAIADDLDDLADAEDDEMFSNLAQQARNIANKLPSGTSKADLTPGSNEPQHTYGVVTPDDIRSVSAQLDGMGFDDLQAELESVAEDMDNDSIDAYEAATRVHAVGDDLIDQGGLTSDLENTNQKLQPIFYKVRTMGAKLEQHNQAVVAQQHEDAVKNAPKPAPGEDPWASLPPAKEEVPFIPKNGLPSHIPGRYGTTVVNGDVPDPAIYKEATVDYAGYAHKQINGILRGEPWQGSTDLEEKYMHHADVLHELISRSELRQDTTLWRGFREQPGESEKFDQLAESLVPGATITDAGFMSTSKSEDIAHTIFSKSEMEGGRGIIVEIDAPQGTKGLQISRLNSLQFNTYGNSEDEVTLLDNTALEIESVDTDSDGTLRVKARVVSQGEDHGTSADVSGDATDSPGPADLEPGSGDSDSSIGDTFPAGPPDDAVEVPEGSGKKFEVIQNTGKSGDGYVDNPGGPTLWGKYGAAGVMIRHVDDDGTERFLLVRRSNGGKNFHKWQLPGGAIDELENDYQGAARELQEELGTDDDYMSKMKPVGEVLFEHPTGWHYNNIAADADEQFEPKVDGKEIDQAKWLTKDEIAQLPIHPALANNLDQIFQQFETKDDNNGELAPDLGEPDSGAPLADWEKDLLSQTPNSVNSEDARPAVSTMLDEAGAGQLPGGKKLEVPDKDLTLVYDTSGSEPVVKVQYTKTGKVFKTYKADDAVNNLDSMTDEIMGFIDNPPQDPHYNANYTTQVDLTPDEHDALEQYMVDSAEMNGIIRSLGDDQKLGPNVGAVVEKLDAIIDKSDITPGTKLWRGVNGDDDPDGVQALFDSLKVGAVVNDKGFMSTSVNQKVTQSFAGKHHELAAVFEIDTPNGGKGIYVDSHLGGATHGGEQEVLLPRNTKLKVTEHTVDEDGTHHVRMELVNDETPATVETPNSVNEMPGPAPVEASWSDFPGKVGLTPEENNALTLYGYSVGYRLINPYLHHDKSVFDTSIMAYRPATPQESAKADEAIKSLDSAFEKAKPIDHAVLVYRRTGPELFSEDNMEGESFTNLAYTSTATKLTSHGYGYETKPVVWEVVLPAGTKALQGNAHENEVLLPRDGHFDVTSDTTVDGVRYLKVTYRAAGDEPDGVEELPMEEEEKELLGMPTEANPDPEPSPMPDFNNDEPGPGSVDFANMKDAGGEYRWHPSGIKLRIGMNVKSQKDGLEGKIVKFEKNHDGIVVEGLNPKSGKVEKRGRKIKTMDVLDTPEMLPTPSPPEATPAPAPDVTPEPPATNVPATPTPVSNDALNSIRGGIPKNYPGVKNMFPGMSDYQIKQYRNAGFALDDAMAAEPHSPEWNKALDKALANLKNAGPDGSPLHKQVSDWRDAQLHGGTTPTPTPDADFGVPAGSQYVEPGHTSPSATWTKQADGTWINDNGTVIAKNDGSNFWQKIEDGSNSQGIPQAPADAVPGTSVTDPYDPSATWVKYADGSWQNGIDTPITKSSSPVGYKALEGEAKKSGVPPTTPGAIAGHPNVPPGATVAQYYGHDYTKHADGSWTSPDGPTIELGSKAEQDINQYALDPSKEPPAQPKQAKPGKYLPDSKGDAIYVGSKVQSTTDNIIGTVVKFEKNGTGVVVVDDEGHKRNRKAHKLYNLDVDAAPYVTGPAMPSPTVSKSEFSTKTYQADPDSPWFDKPKPEKPEAPESTGITYLDDAWWAKAQEQYEAYWTEKNGPTWIKKPLEKSSTYHNYAPLKNGNKTALGTLAGKGYITPELRDEGIAQIDANTKSVLDAQNKYTEALEKWRKDTRDWRKANGMPTLELRGMNDNVHKWTNTQATTWLNANQRAGSLGPGGKMSSSASHAVSSQKSSNISYNLRPLKEKSLNDDEVNNLANAGTIFAMDKAMEESPPVKEDFITIRTFSADAFIDPATGAKLSSSNLSNVVGTIQHDWGFAETSPGSLEAGATPGYDQGNVRMELRVPAGTRGVWTLTPGYHWGHSGERGFILERAIAYYIHSASQTTDQYGNSKWHVQAEIIPKSEVNYDEFGNFVNENPFFD